MSVDWSRTTGAVDSKAYGVNCPACMDPAFTSRPEFVAALRTLTQGKGMIRLHGWGMVVRGGNGQYWLDDDGSWNADKIKKTLAPLVAAGLGPQLLIDIPAGPGGDGDVQDADRFAAFAASLVRIVNVDGKAGVRRWELPNEQESKIDADRMASLLSTSAAAMKAVDSSILVGGPATSWVNVGYVGGVVKALHGAIDFVTVHTYGGDGTQSDDKTFASARDAVSNVAALRAELDALSPGRHIPIYVDEYNTGWNGAPSESDHRGSVYYALLQAGVLEAGGDGTAHWSGLAPTHDMTLIGPDMNLLPPANIFVAMNASAQGQRVATTVTAGSAVTAFATVAEDGSEHALLLVNSDQAPRTLKLSFKGWAPSSLAMQRVDAGGFSGPTVVDAQSVADGGVSVPAESVVLLTSR